MEISSCHHLLASSIHCTMFGNLPGKGSRDIEQIFEQRPAVWPSPLTWKSIGNIYSLRASTVTTLATFKKRGKKISSRHRLVYIQTHRKVPKICPFLQRGHYKKYIQIKFVKIWISNWILLTKNELKQQNNIHMVQYCFFHFLQTKIICLLQICAVSLQETLLHIYSKHFCISPAIIAACL